MNRKFVSIAVAYRTGSNIPHYCAVADDGTAWEWGAPMVCDASIVWDQIRDLPQPEQKPIETNDLLPGSYYETYRTRIKRAVEILRKGIIVGGSHHKTWFIDQAMKALCSEEEYRKIVEEYEAKFGGWDRGIVP